jgi:hypothetical protein
MIKSKFNNNEGAYMKRIDQHAKGVPLMKMNKLATDFVIAFTVILVVSLIVTFLYNLLVYRTSMVDGESSFRIALILGISRSILRQRDKK